jgi:hypothetical protein
MGGGAHLSDRCRPDRGYPARQPVGGTFARFAAMSGAVEALAHRLDNPSEAVVLAEGVLAPRPPRNDQDQLPLTRRTLKLGAAS